MYDFNILFVPFVFRRPIYAGDLSLSDFGSRQLHLRTRALLLYEVQRPLWLQLDHRNERIHIVVVVLLLFVNWSGALLSWRPLREIFRRADARGSDYLEHYLEQRRFMEQTYCRNRTSKWQVNKIFGVGLIRLLLGNYLSVVEGPFNSTRFWWGCELVT